MWFVAVLLLSSLSVSQADTPANCTFEEVAGNWIFYIGQGGNTNKLQCDEFKVVRELGIQLLFPDMAVDQAGNVGFWTMIYNQGFEVQINGSKYFAFSKYTKSGKEAVSYCDQTMNGWSHDAANSQVNWACYYGKKITKVPPKKNPLFSISNLKTRKYVPNKDYIHQINKAQTSWKAGVYDEYRKMTIADMMRRSGSKHRFTLPKPRPATQENLLAAASLPEEFDWRNVDSVNYVSPVRNQGSCGSCYTFGTMGMFEARLRVLTNNSDTRILSTQDIVSCSEYSQGCEGGFPYLVSKYAEDFGVIEEKCYPYEGKDSQCKQSSCSRLYGKAYRYVGGFYGACNEVLMKMELVKNGPMAVSFMVYNDFMHYKGGVYHHTGLQDHFNPFEITNHAVLAVGYGVDKESKEKFWIVKNSWGDSWGENGFFRIRRGTDECAIESIAVSAEPVLH